MKVVKWGVHGTGTCIGPGILLHKPVIGRLVVGSVTTSESLLLYVFNFFNSFRPLWKGR